MCTHRFWIPILVVVAWLAGVSGDAMAQTFLPGDNSLLFVENVGQFEPSVRFLARAGDETLWLLDDALWVSRPADRGARAAMRITFDGANPSPTVTPFGVQDVQLHYYIGADPAGWRTNVPVWRGVRYAELYPGVDLEVYAQSGRWAWQLTGSGDTAAAAARLNVEGADVQAASSIPLASPRGTPLPWMLPAMSTLAAIHRTWK